MSVGVSVPVNGQVLLGGTLRGPGTLEVNGDLTVDRATMANVTVNANNGIYLFNG